MSQQQFHNIPWETPPPPPGTQPMRSAAPPPTGPPPAPAETRRRRPPVNSIPHRSTPEPEPVAAEPEPQPEVSEADVAIQVREARKRLRGERFQGFLGPLWVDGLASLCGWLLLFQIAAKWELTWLAFILSWPVVLSALGGLALAIPGFMWGSLAPGSHQAAAEKAMSEGGGISQAQQILDQFSQKAAEAKFWGRIYALLLLNVLMFLISAYLAS